MKVKSIKGFREFTKQENEDKCVDDQIKLRKTDDEVRGEI
jgi:hypothetical protein